MTLIPDHILRRMDPKDRPKGTAGMTAEEAGKAFAHKREKEAHDIYSGWLRQVGLFFIHSRMDRKSTVQNGTPDFAVFSNGKAIFIEFKQPGNVPSQDQIEVMEKIRTGGTPVHVCQMAADAIEFTRKQLRIPKL